MKIVISWATLFWCLFLSSNVYSATVILKTGKMIQGAIVERTSKYIRVDSEGVRLTTYLDEIESIDGRLIDNAQESSQAEGLQAKNQEQIFSDTNAALVCVTAREAAGERFLGSGFVVSAQGAIITSFHILKNASEVNIKLKDGSLHPALGVVYQDTAKDVCILKINAEGLPTLSLGDSNSAKIGQNFYYMNNPLGFAYSLSAATMRAKRDINGVQWFQFTARGNADNVGGPLINAEGEVIGLVTHIDESNADLNFALAVNDIKPFLERPPILLSDLLKKITPVDYLLIEGFVKFLSGEYDQAIALYDNAVSSNPSNAQVYNNRGNAYEKKGSLDQAIIDYSKSLMIDSSFVPAYLNRAGAYVLHGEADRAVPDYNAAIGLEPENAHAYFSRGNSFFLARDYDQAIADFTTTLQIDPNREQAYYNRGFVYAAKGDYNQAITDYNAAIAINPDYLQVYASRAEAFAKKGSIDQALLDYNKALELNPSFAFAYHGRAAVYLATKQYDNAWQDLRKAGELGFTINPELLENLKKSSGREE